MKLLMHICCANCCLYPVQSLLSKNIELNGLWFNPNIHPYTEYQNRLNALKNLQNIWELDIEYLDNYGLKEFIRTVVNNEDNRCAFCYSMRLDESAKIAKKMGLDGFTTTLLVSPYQKFDMIIDIGKEMEKRYSIMFYVEDFRIGWKEGVRISRELGLYRQKYCGCIYSEMERYLKKSVR
ncbi:MAG: epoxyqueuosine reductase QueH [Nitrospirae bacterium]|jgi:epoxyqueuosine reductase|nr:epoxyqueuosine reductase QueH [Nitrospirota bacterium]